MITRHYFRFEICFPKHWLLLLLDDINSCCWRVWRWYTLALQKFTKYKTVLKAGDCEALKYTFLTPIKPFFPKPHDLWDPPPLVQCLVVSDSVWCRPATLRAIKMFSGTSIGFTRSYPPCTVVHQAVLMSVEKSILYLSSPRFSKL